MPTVLDYLIFGLNIDEFFEIKERKCIPEESVEENIKVAEKQFAKKLKKSAYEYEYLQCIEDIRRQSKKGPFLRHVLKIR